ncbi:MAG TPA: glutaredoxin domain-containing protein [Methanothrix sp.]|nr:NrdH-redoxin [Methanothrix sp.]HPC89962.1 glutaredoxin domain-containing protein [Methanothrix sp.]HQE87529.1 glutaredoxin domain-containing protein [Methanothrix sp.]HQI68179.1 glutaredoxin domain-containing protein [Methanothrix sp.]HRS84961.1 glutaredoxin domain-containing protein [Methanothrix sp.]
MKYTVYTTRTCPKCQQLKAALQRVGIAFSEEDMSTPEALTELRINGVFTLSAPVLQAGESFYTVDDLFTGETLNDLRGVLKI